MENRALIFDIKRDCSEDGPGIRTTVFFKGCPLSCHWCQNPEGKANDPSLMYNQSACKPDKCDHQCQAVCAEKVFSIGDDGELIVNHAACTLCGDCFEVCPSNALQASGYWIGLDELLYRVSIDRPLYDSSGGGVTVSGGEATQQMKFLHRFLKALKERGIHTSLETSGYFDYQRFSEWLLPYLDIIYFDLKLINDMQSLEYTGKSNRLILDNFVRLVKQQQATVIPRIPLIPNITATKQNLQGLARFLERHGIEAATLLPYNPLWQDKMEKLGETPDYSRTEFMSQQEQDQCVHFFKLPQQ